MYYFSSLALEQTYREKLFALATLFAITEKFYTSTFGLLQLLHNEDISANTEAILKKLQHSGVTRFALEKKYVRNNEIFNTILVTVKKEFDIFVNSSVLDDIKIMTCFQAPIHHRLYKKAHQATVNSVKEQFNRLIEDADISSPIPTYPQYYEKAQQKIYTMMVMAATLNPVFTKDMMLEACKERPHFLNDIPFKIIPDSIKEDKDFIASVSQLQSKFQNAFTMRPAKNIRHFQHFSLWQLEQAINNKKNISTALEQYIVALSHGEITCDLEDKVKRIQQQIHHQNKIYIDYKIIELSSKYPNILNQSQNLPTKVFHKDKHHFIPSLYFFTLKYSSNIYHDMNNIFSGICAIIGAYLLLHSMTVIALILSIGVIFKYWCSFTQDKYSKLNSEHNSQCSMSANYQQLGLVF